LEHLELHGHSAHQFGNKATLALLKNCPNLTYWSCHNIQVSGFAEAVTDCGPNTINLCKLAFYNCTLGVRDLKAVVSLCNLKELYIIDFHSLWDENDEFEQVNLTSLQTLTLERCLYLDTKIFKALMKGTTKLQNLNLSYLYQIEGYIDIFAECNLEHLETFRAVYCYGLLECDVEFLKQRCPKLRDINYKDEDEDEDDCSDEYDCTTTWTNL
jgi:hypothetical protein